MQTSTRFGVSYPSPARTDPADAAIHIGNVVAGLEKALRSESGTFAARPVSSVGTPGIVGRMYYGTDDGQMYYDYGTGWITMYNSNSFLIKTNNTSGSNYTYQSFVGAESNPRYAVTARGQQEWGVGTAPADTNLYRRNADQLATDDWFVVRDRIEVFNWTGEVNSAARIIGNASDQRIDFGPGGAVGPDTNLYRAAAGALRTDGSLRIGVNTLLADGLLSGPANFDFRGSNDVYITSALTGAGIHLRDLGGNILQWKAGILDLSSGGTPRITFKSDTNLYRSAADTLKTDDAFVANYFTSTYGLQVQPGNNLAYGLVFSPTSIVAGSRFVSAAMAGAGQPYFVIYANGKFEWGSGGVSASDLYLGRARAGTLGLTGQLALGAGAGGAQTVRNCIVVDQVGSARPGDIDSGGGI